MAIYIYADESGVFDPKNNDKFVMGGIILLNRDDRDIQRRKYLSVERIIRSSQNFERHNELKASILKPKFKYKLYRSLGESHRFAVIVDQKRIHEEICKHKKSKQRYLDYAFKIAVKRALQELIYKGKINPDYSGEVQVFMDEHTTATDGKYELREALEQELIIGTFNPEYNIHFKPVFPNASCVKFSMKDSQTEILIRAADIVANRVYHHAKSNSLEKIRDSVKLVLLP